MDRLQHANCEERAERDVLEPWPRPPTTLPANATGTIALDAHAGALDGDRDECGGGYELRRQAAEGIGATAEPQVERYEVVLYEVEAGVTVS